MNTSPEHERRQLEAEENRIRGTKDQTEDRKHEKSAGELSGELLKRGKFDSKGNMVRGKHNDVLVKEIGMRLKNKHN